MRQVCDIFIRFYRALYLCILAILFPNKFITEVESYPKESLPPENKYKAIFIVTRAFGFSLFLVIIFGGIGYAIGWVWGRTFGCVNLQTILLIQIIGALFLLWGTLFVRGWEIQTWTSVTPIEKVNRWLYRSLCCLGTAIIVFSLVLSPCPK
jgi:hypothetical protein